MGGDSKNKKIRDRVHSETQYGVEDGSSGQGAPDITKENLKIVLSYIERKKWRSCFCFFTDGKQHKARELDMITRDLECP